MLLFVISGSNYFSLKEEEEKEEEEQAKLKDSVSRQTDVALEEMTTPTAREAQEQKGKILDKHEQLCELSRALAVLASASVRIGSNFVEYFVFLGEEIHLISFIFLVYYFSQSVGSVKSS